MLITLQFFPFRTSVTEFEASVKFLISRSGDIVLGNVIRRNILNVVLIPSVVLIIYTLKVKADIVKRITTSNNNIYFIFHSL